MDNSIFIILVFITLFLLGIVMTLGELYIVGPVYTCSGIIILILFEIYNNLKSIIENGEKKEE